MKTLSVTKTVYPICYDKNANKSDQNFNEWQLYLKAELNPLHPSEQVLVEVNKILSSKRLSSLK